MADYLLIVSRRDRGGTTPGRWQDEQTLHAPDDAHAGLEGQRRLDKLSKSHFGRVVNVAGDLIWAGESHHA